MTHKNNTIILANCAHSTRAGGNTTYWAQTAITQRFLFGALGDEDTHIAIAGGAKVGEHKRALGVITDEAEGVSDLVNVQILGSNDSTLQVLTGADIQAGDLITCDGSGKAVPLSAQEAGEYFIYGIALKTTKKGRTVEFTPTAGLEKTQS